MSETSNTPVLQLRGLKTFFHTDEGTVKAVNDVTFDILPGQTLGLVGESGSGKKQDLTAVLKALEQEGLSDQSQ